MRPGERPTEGTQGARFNILNGPDPKDDFGIDMELPKDWWDTTKHPELWEAYIVPAVQQLRQRAASLAHGDDCLCLICSGMIDEPRITNERKGI
jgi:hypothetical protein